MAASFSIVPYSPAHRQGVIDVCLRTGNAGDDATALYPTLPQLLGLRYVVPYLGQPGLAFVLTNDATGAVCGYTLAALDSKPFYAETLRASLLASATGLEEEGGGTSLTDEEQAMLAEIKSPTVLLPAELYSLYPSHLHIDIVAEGQGQGNGTRLMETILGELRSQGSRGVHLEMHKDNARAFGFYTKKLGFKQVLAEGENLYLALALQ